MGEVKLGICSSAAHPLMTRLYPRLQAEFPKIKLNVREGQGPASWTRCSTQAASTWRCCSATRSPPAMTKNCSPPWAPTWCRAQGAPVPDQRRDGGLQRLQGLRLVLPRRPAHWRSVLDETARGKGFNLHAEVEADSLRVQKELVTHTAHLYSSGPACSRLRTNCASGRLQAAASSTPTAAVMTLSLPKQGQRTPASKIVSRLIKETVEGWETSSVTPRSTTIFG